ncbi:MAG: ribosomal rRNA E-loop binding protein Ctc/L25/TL5, large subunit ribosomal protein [Parcubacteria group bacterium]|nr:ribosomal rRNA E-loop binding protein Ctc/L25/TL5, large subunit ribosomal protein [Parcubacteria group bacterium]
MLTINAMPRTLTGKEAGRSLSKEGRIPAVVYGPKQESLSLSLSLHEFKKILRDAGESSVLELVGLSAPLQVLIHDVDLHPVTSIPRHVDFYAIEKGAKVEIAVPLSFVGESPAVKAGSNLVKVMHELEIEADAANLPHELEVDISKLAKDGDQIHVSDIKIPAGVTVKAEMEDVVALVQAVEEEKEEDTAAPDMDAIEVEAKGKAESGDETEEAA